MSNIISIGAEPCASRPPCDPPVAVRGWASDDLGPKAAVIVNPEADQLALLAWAKGELEQANVLLRLFACASRDLEGREFAGAIHHFTEQAERVVKAAFDRLDAQAMAAAQAEA